MPEIERIEWELRSIPLWLLQEYLKDLGGEVVGAGQVRGRGWKASMEKLEDFQLGSIRVGQLRVELEGETQAIKELLPALEKKLMRAGA